VWILLLRYVSLYTFTPSPVRGSFASSYQNSVCKQTVFPTVFGHGNLQAFQINGTLLNTIQPLRKCTRFSDCKYTLRIETVSRLSFLFITCNSIQGLIKRLCITNSWILFAPKFALGDN